MERFSKKLDEDLDYALALSLQAAYHKPSPNQEIQTLENTDAESLVLQNASSIKKPYSIVDKEWETLDPIPDIHSLFLQYNSDYFWNTLAGVEVKWSSRMTLCAGLCCYEGHGGLCSIRLSQPLLKYRPRRDLVETLLHEMIHAYLFVTRNNKDHDAHGPEFLKHMNRINQLTGTNISVYHSFHDEVDVHRQHWWKCDGPCQNRPPYFGLVKRAMNRAPSFRDPWWADHQTQCCGVFIKIKEPENYQKNKQSKRKIGHEQGDIRNFLSSTLSNQNKSSENCSDTDKSAISKSSDVQMVSSSGSNRVEFIPFTGKGYVLGSCSSDINDFSHSSLSSETFCKNSVVNLVNEKPNKRRALKDNGVLSKNSIKSLDYPANEKDSFKIFLEGTSRNKFSVSGKKSVNRLKSEELVLCPACGTDIENGLINDHLDDCLKH